MKIYNLDNINIDAPPGGDPLSRLINSPRSLLAFQRSGITVTELEPVNVEAIEQKLRARDLVKAVPKELVQLRVDMANKNRYNKLRLAQEARNEIIFEQMHGTFAARSTGFAGMNA